MVGIIITWNGPLISLAMKIPAAVVAGNTVVVKPSELTPFSGKLFMDLVEEAGFPPGVINILPGTAEAGVQLVGHPLVKKVTFSGGQATASEILAARASDMKPAVLELGGKSANIIFPDADLDAACEVGTPCSLTALSRQGCAFATRMIVHEDVCDEVVERMTMSAQHIPVGDPFGPATASGPVVNAAAVDRILGMIERAKEQGVTLVAGGSRIDRDGFFIEPTVFTDVDPDSEIAQTEVFGPVLPIFKFANEGEAIAPANNTRYALSSYVQTKDLDQAVRVAAELEEGGTLINGVMNLQASRPFGGFGLSGVGKEGGRQGMEEFLRIHAVGIKL